MTPKLERSSPALQEAERARTFWNAHYDEFLARYPDQFVAVHDGRVIASSAHLVDLLDQIERLGLKPTQVWSKYFATDADRLIL